MNSSDPDRIWKGRSVVVLGACVVVALVLVGRAVDLQVIDKGFLMDQGQARHLRVVEMPAHRGMILDRNGQPLAVSTPVDSVWTNPQELAAASDRLPELAQHLGMSVKDLRGTLAASGEREFVYLRRDMSPDDARKIMDLGIPGVYLQREYRRYYPSGEVAAHVLGFTNVDDVGQEGLELAYNDWLRGDPGAMRVIKDRLGRSVEDVDSLKEPRPGRDLTSSLDLRVQYLAYRELKKAVQEQDAKSGSIVVLDVQTGEVIAMANQPSYNPNNRSDLKGSLYRNRAVTDVFEPGSSFKPFIIAAALESGKYHPGSEVDTAPGFLKVGGYEIHDERDLGTIDLTTILEKSSNVGASKVALTLPPAMLWNTLRHFGFGSLTGSGFPGEVDGSLRNYDDWRRVTQAAISYGYGVSVTALQLARAYTVIADQGVLHPVSFLKLDAPPSGRQVLPAGVAASLRTMLETVVSPAGTGSRAAVPGYRVAGKTGTARKAEDGGYSTDRYVSVFAGMAPASHPRLVMVVVINEPSNGRYYGGLVSAPVFSRVMGGALRLLDIPPDNLNEQAVATVVHVRGPA